MAATTNVLRTPSGPAPRAIPAGAPHGRPARERRRNPRLDTAVSVRGDHGPWYARRAWTGALLDLSATGLSVRIPGRLRARPGEPIRLQLDVPPPAARGRVAQPLRCDVAGEVMWTRPAAGGQGVIYGVRLYKLISEFQEDSVGGVQQLGLLVLIWALAALIIAIKSYNVLWFWYDPLFQVYSTIVAFYIISRMWFALVHKTPPDKGFTPSVSIIISVKNEEDHIAETIERCFRSRYPAHLMEIIVIDDGSTDKTWDVLEGLKGRYPNLKTFHFEKNKGKRHAMSLGCKNASGEVFVMVDSDSYLDPEGIYRLVQGFHDPRVGAIAGHTRAIVEPDNVISKMESVRYFVAHKMMKTAESVFGCVTCCPGCFSAYRASAVMPILDSWLHQTFMGQPATFGDDRSLTNRVLRNYRVIYCDTARCWTYVPNTWAKYFRQQLRWKKSWYRETLNCSKIMWRKHPIPAIFYYIGVLLTFCAPVMVLRNMVIFPLFYSMSCVPYITGIALIYLFFCCVYFYFTRGREWAYGMVFAGLYVGVMCWQNYYAMITSSRPHWGTR